MRTLGTVKDTVVVSGRKAEVGRVLRELEAEGVRVVELKTSNAFHSPVMDPILAEFEAVAAGVAFSKPKIPLVLNRTGAFCDGLLDAKYWRDHLRNEVRFLDSLKTLEAKGFTLFLEVGPQPTLSGMARRCVPGGKFVPSMMQGKDKRILLKVRVDTFSNMDDLVPYFPCSNRVTRG